MVSKPIHKLTNKQRSFLEKELKNRTDFCMDFSFHIGFILKYGIYNKFQQQTLNELIKRYYKYK